MLKIFVLYTSSVSPPNDNSWTRELYGVLDVEVIAEGREMKSFAEEDNALLYPGIETAG